ncbi:MAG: efflux RND transporter periplasmic adaptor subunit [Deltaproteobacteria bacterium]|nr:efflux RND transporter periplasmic adaptor subunit [Deltaproteobacteria bacterium]
MARRFLLVLFLLVAVVGTWAFVAKPALWWSSEPAAAPKSGFYQCAMHPQIVSDKPGTCPICQMKLEHVDEVSPHESNAAGPPASAERKVAMYRHPMRADVTSPNPAKDEMGMDYIPVYEDEMGGEAGHVPGHASFTLSPERQQLIGVTTATLETRSLELDIHAVGRVAYDPMLYQAIVEYREALKSRAATKDSPWPEAQQGSEGILRSATLKLRQQGLSDAQIAALARERGEPTNLLLPDTAVWVYAQVYEYEAPLVEAEQPVEIALPSIPGRTYRAKVTAVDPILNPATRTVRVRMLVPTPDRSLRPESFVKVTIHVPIGEKLAVPREAVLDTGETQIVFVVKGAGTFEPRSVTLGRAAQGYYEVLGGLSAGEDVVTSANFLIDSESRFRSALAAFKKSPHEAQQQH